MPWSAAFGIGLVAFLWLDTFQRYAATDVEGYLLAGVFAVLFYVSILAHELAHAWVARASGNPVHGITLWGLGGYTSFERRRSTPWREGLIAAAGPALTIGLGLLLRAVADELRLLGHPALGPAVGAGRLQHLPRDLQRPAGAAARRRCRGRAASSGA